jgi:hypothetical protein
MHLVIISQMIPIPLFLKNLNLKLIAFIVQNLLA